MMLAEHVAGALAGLMRFEPAIALVHDLGGTAVLIELYNGMASGKVEKLRENTAKALQKLSKGNEEANEMIMAGIADFEDLRNVDLGQ